MKHINNQHLQRLVDTRRAENAKQTCANLPEAGRSAFIDANEESWGYLKSALWQLGQMKCWYSEARLQQQEGHVEHFRPKKQIHGEPTHPGYWWRAFDWTNMRLSHPTSNIRRRDYLTGEVAGKGSYFPLQDGCTRATNEATELNEIPVLLDPANSIDCKLLCFDSESGRPIPRFSKDKNAWKNYRASESITYYHLDEGTWNFNRKDLMDEVSVLCNKIIQAEKEGKNSDTLIGELLSYVEPHAEFISAVEQVICEKGLLERMH